MELDRGVLEDHFPIKGTGSSGSIGGRASDLPWLPSSTSFQRFWVRMFRRRGSNPPGVLDRHEAGAELQPDWWRRVLKKGLPKMEVGFPSLVSL